MARLLIGIGVLALVLIAAVALVGYTAWGNQFAANQIASLISTPDMQVKIDGARGLLAGNLRVDRITVADTKGQFADVKDVALDWSPLDLLSFQFHAEKIAAASVDFERTPVQTIEPPPPSDGSFSLPVEVVVDNLDLPSIALGQSLIGRPADLALKGSARAVSDTIALKLDASQKGNAASKAIADLAYAVNAKTLKLDLTISEPKGGLLATALQLPNSPALDLSVTGDGPLAGWAGVIRAKLDGTERLAINASHSQNASGMHDVMLSGGGAIGELMPPAVRSLFENETAIDVDASFDNEGHLDIRSGKIANGSLTLDVMGKVDPRGRADLNGSLRAANEVIALHWPLSEGMLDADIRNVNFVMSGPFNKAAITLSADLAQASLPQGRFDDVTIQAGSDGFDLATGTGHVDLDLNSPTVTMADPQLAKLVKGPIELKTPLELTATSIKSTAIELSSGAIGGKATLDFGRDTQAIASNFDVFVAPLAILPPDLAAKAGKPIHLSGTINGTPDDLAFDKVAVDATVAKAELSGTLKAGEFTTSLTGDIPSLTPFAANTAGSIQLSADISGPLQALVSKANITSSGIAAGGRTIDGIDVVVDATLDPANAGGKLTATAQIDGEKLTIASDAIYKQGLISLPSLNATIGSNTVTGALELGPDFLPNGKINADLPDLATLAKLAGQTVTGDLKATVALDSVDGQMHATVNGTGTRIASGNIVLAEPIIHIESADLLAGRAAGSIKLRDVTSGTTRVEAVQLDFDHRDLQTSIKLDSTFEGAPLTAAATIDQSPASIGITLASLAASPAKIPLTLASPAKITLDGGRVAIDNIILNAGSGRLIASGTAGDTLDLAIRAEAIPASLVNGLSPGLDASGAISANATVKGNATAPVIAFDLTGTDITAKPLKDAGRAPLQIASKGSLAQSVLLARTTIDGIAELGTLDIDNAIRLGDQIRIEKFALSGPALKGAITGFFTPDTQAIDTDFAFDLTGNGLVPPAIAASLKGPARVTGKVTGTPDDISLSDIKVDSNILTADASGTMKAGTLAAKLSAALPDLKALQPDASGAVQFTADLTGPTSALTIKAQVTSSEAVLAGRPLRNLAVNLDGTLAAAPTAKLTATGTIDGQPINIAGDLVSENGEIRIPGLKADIGRNTLSGDLTLDPAFQPTGKMAFDLPDIGLLAALAGQKAQGDLKGTADVNSTESKISATISASGTGIAAQGLTIKNPAVDLKIPDLATGQISGNVGAAELSASGNTLTNLAANFALVGNRTDFDINGTLDAAPLVVKGAVTRQATGLEISLAELSASPKSVPIKLASPAAITIANGTTSLGTIALDVGGGAITITGSAGSTLDIKLDAPALPMQLADMVSPGLGAQGTLAAKASVTGPSSDPLVDFQILGKQLSVKQTRDAGRNAFNITATGTFQQAVLTTDVDINGIKELGDTKLSAKVATEAGATVIRDLTLSSPALTAAGTATLRGTDLDATIRGEIVDIAKFLPNASGKAIFDAKASGPLTALKVKATLSAVEARMAGRALRDLKIDLDAVADPAKPTGKLAASGTLDSQVIDVTADLVSDQGRISIPAINAKVGRNIVTGAITLTDKMLPTGSLKFELPDLGLLAALAGQKASGDLSGLVDLTDTDGKISAKLKANGTGITAQGLVIKNPAVDLTVPDLLTVQISGTAKATEIASGANRLTNLDAGFDQKGSQTGFDVKGNYDGAPLTAKGAVDNGANGLSLTLSSFAASPKNIPVKLSAPVTIDMKSGAAAINNLTIATGRGSIVVNGTAGDALDLKIKVSALPASLANTFASGLDASGTISANAIVTGASSNPVAAFDVNWQSAMTSQIRAAGISPLAVTAKGSFKNTVLSIDTNVRGAGGLTLAANGTVATSGNQALNLGVKGKLPFSTIAGQLAAQGLALKGDANFDLKIAGTTASPAISGRITTNGGQFIAIRQNVTVNKLSATVALNGQTATISEFSGRMEGGGKVSASGTIGFAPGSGYPANITIKLDNAVYADGRVVVAKLDGDLNIKGPLANNPALGGTIKIKRADITVPERLPASLANANVKHIHAPADVLKQAGELRADSSSSVGNKQDSGIRLSLKIVGQRKIFVRGRGLDAELGGQVLVSGSSANPSVSGGFKMRRGRLAIIGKRLDFTTGEITFGGGLVPALNMVASTTVNANTLNVNVNGPANDPSFSFTSSPALPQDEVLAQLIFGRESSSLSPFQIAQLADAVATLSGGQRTSLFNKLRQGLGIDDLNVGTDENGGAQVTAGKYLNRRTYLELKQGESDSESGVAINLDIGKGVKLRGEANADGNTSTGIFYEKEY